MAKNKHKEQPLLSLAMMVKNEERFLEDALLSARDWVDEMIVVDTGSTDRTVEIARDCGAEVSFFPWPDNFSIARNETIKRARGDWIAILDADERFRGAYPHRIRDLLKPGKSWPYQAFLLNIVNQNLDGEVTHSFFNPRIFPRHPDLGYVGRVHNCFGSLSKGEQCDFDFVQCSGLEIVHLGYDQSIYQERQKVERNLSLLEAAVRDEPDIPRYRYYLGREYVNLKRFTEAKVLLQSVIKQPNIDELTYRETRLTFLQCLHAEEASFTTQLHEAVNLLEEHPNEVDAWYFLAMAYQSQGLNDEAVAALIEGLSHIGETDAQMGQVCRLAGDRAQVELAIARHFCDQVPPDQERSCEYAYAAWEHLSSSNPQWVQIAGGLLALAMKRGDTNALKSILIGFVEKLEGRQAYQAFLVGVRKLAEIGEPKSALKVLRRAISQRPELHRDQSFAQIVSTLKRQVSKS